MVHPLFQPLDLLLPELAPVWAVGGSVRAVLTGEPLDAIDIDLTTPNPVARTEQTLLDNGIAVNTQGKRWGALSFVWRNKTYDILQFRKDIYTPGNRFPQVVFTPFLHHDAVRRDFTFNAIYLAPDGTIDDTFNGVADLQAQTVRFIGNPAIRVAEDPLRMLRFLRFCAKYGTAGLTEELIQLANQSIPQMQKISQSKQKAELTKFVAGAYASNVIKRLEKEPVGKWLEGVL